MKPFAERKRIFRMNNNTFINVNKICFCRLFSKTGCWRGILNLWPLKFNWATSYLGLWVLKRQRTSIRSTINQHLFQEWMMLDSANRLEVFPLLSCSYDAHPLATSRVQALSLQRRGCLACWIKSHENKLSSTSGGQLTRQISSSHVIPRSMSGYQDFFRYIRLNRSTLLLCELTLRWHSQKVFIMSCETSEIKAIEVLT